jgi:hypothetical protein
MSTKKHELERAARGEGCLDKAANDEPIFILRGQDKLAPIIVEMWAGLAEATVAGDIDAKIHEARMLARKMREWPKRKMPD